MSNMNSNLFWSSNLLLVDGRLVGGWCIWLVVGWSVGKWSVLGSRLVSGFKETPIWWGCILESHDMLHPCILTWSIKLVTRYFTRSKDFFKEFFFKFDSSQSLNFFLFACSSVINYMYCEIPKELSLEINTSPLRMALTISNSI